jgi:hypothetical protein
MMEDEDPAAACPEWDSFPTIDSQRSRWLRVVVTVQEAEGNGQEERFAAWREAELPPEVVAAAVTAFGQDLRARRAAPRSALVALPPRRRQGPA